MSSLTFDRTARRSFENAYWTTVAKLATGRYVNKDNADCVTDPATRSRLAHHQRDLEALGDHLLAHYQRLVDVAGLTGRALVGELPFHWRTDFQFAWSGGWQKNQAGEIHERNLVVVIPGKIAAALSSWRSLRHGLHGRRVRLHEGRWRTEACRRRGRRQSLRHGRADARRSDLPRHGPGRATRKRRLAGPPHGEEFPSDCMGARHLCERLVERQMRIRLTNGRWRDLSRTRSRASTCSTWWPQQRPRPRRFQICPARAASRCDWPSRSTRRTRFGTPRPRLGTVGRPGGRTRGKRSADGATLPRRHWHLPLHGEVRPPHYPRSALYNTDGQISPTPACPWSCSWRTTTSTARLPRQPRHDGHIDLDYGAAVAAIAIETVARVASEKRRK